MSFNTANDAHARQMDSVYRGQRHIYDLTRKYYLLGRDQIIAQLQPAAGTRVLEIGCGTGRNLICAAQKYPQVQFYGLDISNQMLATARQNIAKAGLSGRITVAQGDATGFDCTTLFGIDGVDCAWFSYALSMIPDWKAAMQQGISVVRPGGALHLVDFGQQERLPGLFRRMLFGWLGKFHVTPRADLHAEAGQIAAQMGAQAQCQALYRGYAWTAKIVRAA